MCRVLKQCNFYNIKQYSALSNFLKSRAIIILLVGVNLVSDCVQFFFFYNSYAWGVQTMTTLN